MNAEEISAQAYTIIDLETGAEVMGQSSDLPLSMAGFVRLMNLKVVLDSADFDPYKTVVIPASNRPEETFFANEEISTETAIFAMLMADSADAAEALAVAYGPGLENFVQKMNQAADELGLTNINFNDATGESAGTLASAGELAKLLRDLHKHSEFQELYLRQAYLIPNTSERPLAGLRQIENPARQFDLMTSPYLSELKGLMFTENHDNWAYGAAESLSTNGRPLLAVVLGASTKREEITGAGRTAQVLRTLMENAAKELGAEPSRKASILSLGRLAAQDKPQNEVKIVETTKPSASIPTTTASEAESTEDAEDALAALTTIEKNTDSLMKKGLLYGLVAILVLAVISLIVFALLQQRKRSRAQAATPRPRTPQVAAERARSRAGARPRPAQGPRPYPAASAGPRRAGGAEYPRGPRPNQQPRRRPQAPLQTESGPEA